MPEFTQHYDKKVPPRCLPSSGAQRCSEDEYTGVLPKDQNMASIFAGVRQNRRKARKIVRNRL